MENSSASSQARHAGQSDQVRQELNSHPARIRAMFDRIAPTYDLLNRLISFGLDTGWRRRAISLLAEHSGGAFLDIAAGSGDISVGLRTLSPRFIAGTDFSLNMLRQYDLKLRSKAPVTRFGVAACDALSLPFRDRTFDGAITAFGIRNFADRPLSLREMYRVLRPGGTVVILELTVPEQPLLRDLHAFHSKYLLPIAGRIVSGDASAYRYLPESIEAFPSSPEFLSMMDAAGFVRTQARPLTFGAATIFSGRKA